MTNVAQLIEIERLQEKTRLSDDALEDLYLCDYFGPEDEFFWLEDLKDELAEDLIVRLRRLLS